MTTMEMFEVLWVQIEQAIDQHPKLHRVPGENPTFHTNRDGTEVSIHVTFNRRKTPRVITGQGETPELATKDLIHSLDTWVSIIDGRKTAQTPFRIRSEDL